MKLSYNLAGLDCQNCATKLENEISKINGVKEVTASAMSESLTVTLEDDFKGDVDKQIIETVNRIEPEIVVTKKVAGQKKEKPKNDDDKKEQNKKLTQIIIGLVLFITGFVLQYFEVDDKIVLAVFLASYLVVGLEVVVDALKDIKNGKVFDENFLMSIATIGAFAIGENAEAVAVMLFFQVGEYFQDLAVNRSKKNIADLMDIRPDHANLKKDNEIVVVSPEDVEVGDVIVIKAGERIPLDGKVLEGKSLIDTKSLTGESVPRSVSVGDEVLSGCVNQSGLLTVEVTKPYGESTVTKIIDLVENASSKKAPTENFITTFSRYYTPIVVICAALLAIVPPLFFQGVWSEWINRGLIFLVISCPCALVISIPLGFFGGIGNASKRGILVKGGNSLEALNNLDIVVFDKTGTLTKGVFDVTNIINENNYSKDEVLEYAAFAESFSTHPIGLSVLKAYGKEINQDEIKDYTEIAGHGISIVHDNKVILVGNDKLMVKENIDFKPTDEIGTKIYVAVDGTFVGTIIISDEVKDDSKEAITKLKQMGINKTVMLTGDDDVIANKIGSDLGLDEVYAKLLPQDKVTILEEIDKTKREKGKLAFVGDGINDAPVLARADVGIAMGGVGSDSAIEAADVVLMTDEPTKIAEAVDIAKFTHKIVWQNIIFALGVKFIILGLGAFGIATMWEAVFADVGVSIIAILNSMRVLKYKDKK